MCFSQKVVFIEVLVIISEFWRKEWIKNVKKWDFFYRFEFFWEFHRICAKNLTYRICAKTLTYRIRAKTITCRIFAKNPHLSNLVIELLQGTFSSRFKDYSILPLLG